GKICWPNSVGTVRSSNGSRSRRGRRCRNSARVGMGLLCCVAVGGRATLSWWQDLRQEGKGFSRPPRGRVTGTRGGGCGPLPGGQRRAQSVYAELRGRPPKV